jgi:hypothetical protein
MAIDVSNYTTWGKLTSPSGDVYYEVPDSGLVYDPIRSQATGRNVFHPNPKAEIAEKEKAEKLMRQQMNPLNQAMPTLAALGGTLGAKAIGSYFPSAQEKMYEAMAKNIAGDMGAPATAAPGSPASSFLEGIFGSGSSPAVDQGVASLPNGGTLLADGSVQGPMGPGGFLEVGSTLGNLAGGLGTGLGLYGAYEGIKDQNPLMAGLGGLGTSLGLSQLGVLGSAFGPLGLGIAAVPAVTAFLSGMFDKDEWKNERNDLEDLKEKGIFIPDDILSGMPTRGRSFDELQQMEIARGADQADINFAKSRDINDLKGHGQSIIGYSEFAKKDPNWFKRSIEERTNYANQLLDLGLVSEGKGQIKVDWGKAPPLPGTEAQDLGKQLAEKQNSKRKK